ncbi:3,4-dioxygenase subunit beta [Microlunatus capsulatus]|uniref:Protocatechuate 3,4-dioxygenase beta subunit n=1 Tax=Microlunatus capsulatus TaxID=99117 RepID=A0ABS4Z362_9ACTN|nr:3,4-dioxygenase subunit beta [Microlunatus capsulatus]MBP2415137.1 protocatechuate 3,4-dioxygenase beta subunit [Microlunatus capsulatus]
MPSQPHPSPTYEGRPLDRTEEELTDQGLPFDVVTLLSRRRLLRAAGLGATAVTLTACGATAATSGSPSAAAGALAEIPDETAGPYPGDGSNGPDVLEQSGIVRRDIRSSFGDADGTAEGVAMTLQLDLVDLADGSPFTGAAVYVWHCTREGGYSLYSDGITGENYLRGVQVADDDGAVTFTSVFPGCYSGRWPHVHFEVYPDVASTADATAAIATSQVALPEDVCRQVYGTDGYAASVANLDGVSLADDNVFGDDDGANQLGTVTGDVAGGLTVRLAVGIDTSTQPVAGQAPGGGAGGPGGAPPSGAPSGGPGGSPPSGAPTAGSTPG